MSALKGHVTGSMSLSKTTMGNRVAPAPGQDDVAPEDKDNGVQKLFILLGGTLFILGSLIVILSQRTTGVGPWNPGKESDSRTVYAGLIQLLLFFRTLSQQIHQGIQGPASQQEKNDQMDPNIAGEGPAVGMIEMSEMKSDTENPMRKKTNSFRRLETSVGGREYFENLGKPGQTTWKVPEGGEIVLSD